MHLLIIILQQLLGMLPSSKQAPQAEVVRRERPQRERPQANGSEGDACLRLASPITGWMSVLTVLEGLRHRPPYAVVLRRNRSAQSVAATATITTATNTAARPAVSSNPSRAE